MTMDLSSNSKPKSWILAIGVLAGALAVNLTVFALTRIPSEEIVKGDAVGYLQLAENLIQHRLFGEWDESNRYSPNVSRTPLYPLYVAAHTLVFGEPLPWLYMTQSLLTGMTAVLCFYICRLHVHPRAGIPAAAIIAIDPAINHNVLSPLSEALYLFLLTGGIFTLLQWHKTGRVGYLVGCSISFSLSAITKPISLFLLVPIAILIGFRSIPFRQRMTNILLFTVCFVSLPGIWIVRNQVVADFPSISSITGVNFYFYRTAGVLAKVENISFEDAQKRLRQAYQNYFRDDPPTPRESHRYLMNQSVDYMRVHPWQTLEMEAEGSLRLLFGPSLRYIVMRTGGHLEPLGLQSAFERRNVVQGFLYLLRKNIVTIVVNTVELIYLLSLYVLSLVGIWFYLRPQPWRTSALMALLLYFLLLSSGPEAGPRLRIPLIPMVAILADIGISQWIQHRKNHEITKIAIGRRLMSLKT